VYPPDADGGAGGSPPPGSGAPPPVGSGDGLPWFQRPATTSGVVHHPLSVLDPQYDLERVASGWAVWWSAVGCPSALRPNLFHALRESFRRPQVHDELRNRRREIVEVPAPEAVPRVTRSLPRPHAPVPDHTECRILIVNHDVAIILNLQICARVTGRP